MTTKKNQKAPLFDSRMKRQRLSKLLAREIKTIRRLARESWEK